MATEDQMSPLLLTKVKCESQLSLLNEAQN